MKQLKPIKFLFNIKSYLKIFVMNLFKTLNSKLIRPFLIILICKQKNQRKEINPKLKEQFLLI